jgi:hypothetical protein
MTPSLVRVIYEFGKAVKEILPKGVGSWGFGAGEMGWVMRGLGFGGRCRAERRSASGSGSGSGVPYVTAKAVVRKYEMRD